MAKAIRFHAIGGPEVLCLETVDVGDPGPGQARVRQTAIAVNFIDIYFRTGLYPAALPSGLGSDAVGVRAADERDASARPTRLRDRARGFRASRPRIATASHAAMRRPARPA